jgi:hypothetical protein
MEKTVYLLETEWGGIPMWWGDEDWTEVRTEGRVFDTEREAEDFGWSNGLDDVYPVPL